MDSSSIAILISAAGLAVIILDRVWGGSWKLASRLAALEKSVDEAISKTEEKILEKHHTDVKLIGDSMFALREKVNDVEKTMARDYVDKEFFLEMWKQNASAIETSFKLVHARFDRIEQIIDRSRGVQ
jgi:hypothetical protein